MHVYALMLHQYPHYVQAEINRKPEFYFLRNSTENLQQCVIKY